MKQTSFFAVVFVLALQVSAQSVIFPQEQQAGTATSAVVADDTYTLANDLFSASFVLIDGKLTFGGCEAMGMMPSDDLFSIRLGNGTEVASSSMTLKGVEAEDLAADASAAKGSLKLPGKSIKATYTYANLTLTWRAVLRDGSHYLRTELELTAIKDVAMNAIIPMHYTIDTSSSEHAPVVVGNTRGAVIASDKIFAGLETPMGKNSIVGALNAEPFVYDRWTSTTFSWTPGSETPQGILNLGLPVSGICGVQGYLGILESGRQTVTFQYTSGNHRLDIAGVDIVDLDGNVVAYDYHKGYTGGQKSRNVYTLNIPERGYYLVRYFRDTVTDGITATFNSNGNITWSCEVTAPELVYDGNMEANVLPESSGTQSSLPSLLEVGGTRTDTWNTSSWSAPAAVPSRIVELGYTADRIKMMSKQISFAQSGGLFSAQFMYASGYHGLTIAGVELVDADGNVAASDYHSGFSGTAKTDNIGEGQDLEGRSCGRHHRPWSGTALLPLLQRAREGCALASLPDVQLMVRAEHRPQQRPELHHELQRVAMYGSARPVEAAPLRQVRRGYWLFRVGRRLGHLRHMGVQPELPRRLPEPQR